MKVAALFSGGKDSTFAIYKAQKEKHSISCLVTIFPESDESKLLHFPNSEITKLQAQSMHIPQIYIQSKSNETLDELNLLDTLIKKAKNDYCIEGVIHGGLASQFQKNNYEKLCKENHLEFISPLWGSTQKEYLIDLINSGFRIIITSVSAGGLDDSWLGKELTRENIEKLSSMSKKFGFNINFEGGEAETLVIDCPLFRYPINIKKSKNLWDGYRGRFEIEEAELDYSAR